MKKIHILIALLGLVGTSCSNQELETGYIGSEEVMVSADFALSRVSFSETDNVTYANWENGDGITLNTPTQGNLNYTATVTETAVTFASQGENLKDIAGETVYACYPAATIIDGVVTLPATNKWADTNKPLPFAYAVSSIADSKVKLAFEHSFAFLKLTLPAKALENVTTSDGNKTVHKLLVKSASESLAVVSGTFKFEDKTINVTEKSGEIELTLTEAFNPAEETERSFYVPILPQAGDVEMSFSLIQSFEGDVSLLEMKKQTPTDGLVAGRVYKLAIGGTEGSEGNEGNNSSSGTIEGEAGEIHLGEGGQLSTFITAENKYTIKSLKLSGYLNGDDIRILRDMAGVDLGGSATEGQLTVLDLGEATIVEGGEYYCQRYESPYKKMYTKNYELNEFIFSKTKLKTITLPKNTTKIWACTFKNCTSLEEVIIPEGVTYIGSSSFYRNSALKSLVLPESVQTIAQQAFYECTSLNEISIPDNAELEIEKYAFYSCTSLSNLSLGKKVKNIGESAFEDCSKLLSVTIPENSALTTIGKKAFQECNYLTSFTIPDGVSVTIGDYAFYHCDALGSVSLGNATTSIGANAFNYCTSLGTVSMGDAVTEIGASAFQNCTSLMNLTMSKGLITLGTSAFYKCSSLKTITIPEGVSIIEESTFSTCSNLKSVTIPDAVTSIGKYAFSYCKALESAEIGKSVETIVSSAFSHCNNLKKIVIPDAVVTIEANAFANCTSLEEVSLGSNIKTIGNRVFYECGALKEIILPESLETLGGGAFEFCSSLTKAYNIIGDNGYIFNECYSLSEVTFSPKTTKIGEWTFTVCKSLTDVDIPDGVLEIGIGAFRSCVSLQNVNIPENVILIGTDAFAFCESLDNVVIPDKITVLKEDVLFDHKSMTKVTIGKSVTTIESGNFQLNLGGTYLSKVECICKPTSPPIFKGTVSFSTAVDDVAAAKLYVPKGSKAAYEESDWAKYFGTIIEMEE